MVKKVDLEIQDEKGFDLLKTIYENAKKELNKELEKLINNFIKDILSEIESIL